MGRSRRDQVAVLFAFVTIACFACAFLFTDGTQFLMPGPLTSAHGAIKTCTACHTASGTGKLSWVHGLIPRDPLADSKACLACHKIPDTAFNPHTATGLALLQSRKRMAQIVKLPQSPLFARAQTVAFPTDAMIKGGLNCATCHQEHQGASFKLNKISNEQCRSCHVVKFDSFDGSHPQFDGYPFQRRTRIIYDHAGHFDKHFPDVAKKEPAKHVPETCSSCHDNRADGRIMAVAPFEKTCSGCHINQITGKDRASGPKGIAFLALPGLDLQTLRSKGAPIGEWPDASEAELTPFMKIMIGRSEKGRAALQGVSGANLQDLTKASDDQIKAATDLAWEIKRLFYALISGKTSDALANLNIGGGKLSPGLVADLTANIPRDVVTSAQQEWLPHLATEIANGPITAAQAQPELNTSSADPPQAAAPKSDEPAEPEAPKAKSAPAKPPKAAEEEPIDPPGCLLRVLGQCLVSKGAGDGPATSKAGGDGSERSKTNSSAANLPPAMQAGLGDLAPSPRTPQHNEYKNIEVAQAEAGKDTPPVDAATKAKSGGQADDLLFPTAQELREMKDHRIDAPKGGQTEGPRSASPSPETAGSHAAASIPVISIQSDVDPESWAEYGGWYRQDYAIYYRPTGHKDKFIYSWLFLTGPKAPRGASNPASAVFDALTNKDAQGACTKCHSIDDIQGGKGRVVNFSPLSVADTQGRFTSFLHEPHFGVVGSKGCLTCHALGNDKTYLKSYEQGDPHVFASNFASIKKEQCQSCHTASVTRQDCLTCHKYHVNGVLTPIINTKVPTR